MGTLALIGLGSNLGDRRAILDAAARSLDELPGTRLLALSRYHETAPVGGPSGQRPFMNAAASIETTLDPLPLLASLQEIEARAGRVRAVRWGERTLDLDLLLFDRQILDLPGLSVPHPWMAIRRFVLAPLCEIAPDQVEPVTRRTIRSLLKNLDRRPSTLCLRGCWTGSLPAWRTAFEKVGRVLDADRAYLTRRGGPVMMQGDETSPSSDRWTIADFAPEELVDGSEPAPGGVREAGRVSQPTLVVQPRITGANLMGRDSLRMGGAPTLDLDADDADELANWMIDACRATRSPDPAAMPGGFPAC